MHDLCWWERPPPVPGISLTPPLQRSLRSLGEETLPSGQDSAHVGHSLVDSFGVSVQVLCTVGEDVDQGQPGVDPVDSAAPTLHRR